MSNSICTEKRSESLFYIGNKWSNSYRTNWIGDQKLKGIRITVLEKDTGDRLWIGTSTKGICRFDRRFTEPATVLSNGIRRINDLELDPQNGRFYIATNSGLAIFNKNHHRMVSQTDGLVDNHVTHLNILDNDLLLSTERGLSIFDLQTLHCEDRYDRIANYHVYCTEVYNGHVFLGTYDGLKMVDDGKIRFSFDTSNSELENNWITALLNYKNMLYVGTYGGGICFLNSHHEITSLKKLTGSCEVNFNAMCTDGHHIYAGTMAHGLIIIDPETQEATRITKGLLSPNVTAVDCDEQYLYIGTENGLTRIEKRSL